MWWHMVRLQNGYQAFTQPHTDHEVKCKIRHKWLRCSHLASAPAVLIQVGHYTVAWYRHRQATAHTRQLDYVLTKKEVSCRRPGLQDRHCLFIMLVLDGTKVHLLILSLLNVIHSLLSLFPYKQKKSCFLGNAPSVLYASKVTQHTCCWKMQLIIKHKLKQRQEQVP